MDSCRYDVVPGIREVIIVSILGGFQERLAETAVPAALKQLYVMAIEEAEVLTLNAMFHGLALIFLPAPLLLPWVSKVPTANVEVIVEH